MTKGSVHPHHNCTLPTVAAEPPKPKFPKKYIEFVDEEAMDWLTNLVDID